CFLANLPWASSLTKR
ncbi:pyruvate kinase isozyme a chloroplastic, partial [Phtheirospermum japonicum]